MRIQNCLFSLMLIAASAQGEIPDAYRGDWLLVNGAVVLHVDDDGTMTLRNSGDKGRLSLNKDGTFTWEVTSHPRSGRFSDGKLLLKSEEEGAPKWMAYLEFRKGEKELADELIQFATRQQTEAATKMASARRKYIQNMILNNLRQLDGAAIQFSRHSGRALGRRTLMEPPKEIRNCTVNFQCPKLWKRLATTDDPKVRFCDQCFEQVYLVQNEQELAEQSARGRCVAILNLSPQHEAYSGEGLIGEIEPDWSAFDKFKKDENNET